MKDIKTPEKINKFEIIEKTCLICNRRFLARKWKRKTGLRPKYCSEECSKEAARRQRRIWKQQQGEKYKEYMRRYRRDYYRNNKERVLLQNRSLNVRYIQRARELLGGKCQLCNSLSELELCHINPTNKYRPPSGQNATHMNAIQALKNPNEFLLLCKSCHANPEPWLKKFIELRKLIELNSLSIHP